jgi:HEAT repeat protein
MRKFFLFLIALHLLTGEARAQQGGNKSASLPGLPALVAKFPAQNATQLNELMQKIGQMGEPGVVGMVRMFQPAGEGDNTKLEFALGGFSYYVMQGDREDLRRMASMAYSKALAEVQNADPKTKAFVLSQLQVVGKEEAIPHLTTYLQQEGLCGPAARALAQINSEASQKALSNALATAPRECQLSLLEALGESPRPEALGAIRDLAGSPDQQVKKLALLTLASSGDPASGLVLAAEAEKAGYTFDETNATSSYLLWARRMVEAGHTDQVNALARALLAKSTQPDQVHTRIAALALLVEINGQDSLPLLLAAANDPQKEYRVAALQHASAMKGADLTAQWVKRMRKARPEVKADILAMLGNRRDAAALPAVRKQIRSKNEEVKIAAVEAGAKLGQEAVLPVLLKELRRATPPVAEAVKRTLLSLPGTNLVPAVAEALPKASPAGKAALLEILGTRRATEHIDLVVAEADSKEPLVRLAAFRALQPLVSREHAPVLFSLLEKSAGPEEAAALQAAVGQSLKEVTDKEEQTELVLQRMAQVPGEKKPLFYPILATIGSEKALQAVVAEFSQGSEEAKKEALSALGNWTNNSATNELYRIAQHSPASPYFEPALQGYIRQVGLANYTPEQKLLLLRKAMDLAQDPEQQKLILRGIGRPRTLGGLMYAGKFLDDAALKEEAAQTVLNIAVSNKGFYGNEVMAFVQKSLEALPAAGQEYLKFSVRRHLEEMPVGEGFVSLFNGQDLAGWKGLVADPLKRAKMDAKTLTREQQKADEIMRKGWRVEDGVLVFSGQGDNLATVKKYGDFEMFVDWKIAKDGDAGIYLRGTPQVQIWDPARHDVGAQVGSGGLYNNQQHESKPLKVADNPVGEWNTFRILMQGERVTVYLNGEKVADDVILENYWDRQLPIFPEEQLELQAHGTEVAYRDLYLREIPRAEPFTLSAAEKKEGYRVLFDGTTLHHWTGNTRDYVVEDGALVIYPDRGGQGNLYTKEQFSDFVFRFEFQLTPGANNGLGLRAPMEGDAAYTGMELQILDNEADKYKDLQPYQYHGSVYGVIPAKRGYLKEPGEWNYQEVQIRGPKIKVTLNGTVILDGDLAEASKNGTPDGKDHPGLKRTTGHIGFLGHGDVVKFRNIRIKELNKKN